MAKTITIHRSQTGEVSYRMTANGFIWGNRSSNVAEGLDIGGYPDMAGRIKIW